MRILLILLSLILGSCNPSDKIIHYPEGGYNYPKNIDAKDSNFYFLPIKNLEPPIDSILDAFYSRKYFPIFKEENLSIGPLRKEIFRLTCIRGLVPDFLISISEGSITVKKSQRTSLEYLDNMTELERFYLDVYMRNFPIKKSNEKIKKNRQHFLDSLINIYPELPDANYFRFLLEKVHIPYQELYTYTTTKISISKNEYSELINLINESAYWKLPFEFICRDIPHDAGQYILEANTARKYNFVRSVDCGDSSKYLNVIYTILKAAKIRE